MEPCPICHPPEPKYGELDVATVATWLKSVVVQGQDVGAPAYGRMARAVIRLANEAHKRGHDGTSPPSLTKPHDLAAWLDRIGMGE